MSEDHLTKPHSERINQLIARTPAGMAHWAGTGPAGKRCIDCAHAKFNGYHKKMTNSGTLKPITCKQRKKMVGNTVPFNATVAACRFFQQGEGPPVRK